MVQRMRFGMALFGLFAVLETGIAAQVTTGTIVGAVRDANGVVPGAAVTIREVNKGTADNYVTDETGSYTAPFLGPGTYTVEVNVQGFRKWRRGHPPGQSARASRRDARSWRHRGNDDGRG